MEEEKEEKEDKEGKGEAESNTNIFSSLLKLFDFIENDVLPLSMPTSSFVKYSHLNVIS